MYQLATNVPLAQTPHETACMPTAPPPAVINDYAKFLRVTLQLLYNEINRL